MPDLGGPLGPNASKPKALAFYLPQYHPIPENDEWWGKGFTEWVNVAKARPLFPGHYQPHVPGELGYYDLRVPEVREAQAELARTHGISGFVYYHYWFHGRRLLERPFDEVLASGSPDFPFALCWANEEWTRNWDAQTGRVLMPQQFSAKDDLDHLRWLAKAFADDRYIKIDGRPLMLVYRPMLLPDPKRTTDLWRAEAQKLGFPDLYLGWVESRGGPPGGPAAHGFDAAVRFMPPRARRVFEPLESIRGHEVLDYVAAYEMMLSEEPLPWKRFPSVTVGWDNTARRPRGALLFEGATPKEYRRWLKKTVASVADVREEENYLFILAWNEWAEGNHLEPDLHYGRAFLEATRSIMVDSAGRDTALALARGEEVIHTEEGVYEPSVEYAYPFVHDSAVANAVGLIATLDIDPHRLIVDLGAGTGVVHDALKHRGAAYHALEVHPPSVSIMQAEGIDATQCDITDVEALTGILDDFDDVGGLLLLDVIEHLPQPHEILSALSAWSLKNGEPALVISVPNVAHFDLGLGLLTGEWSPTKSGLLDSTHLRFFTEATLERMVTRCGWRVVARDDFHAMHSDKYDPGLIDVLPEEMVGALRVLSEAYNPQWAVQQFVWALAPAEIEAPPETFFDAVGQASDQGERQLTLAKRYAVSDYLASVGLVANEANRRALAIRLLPKPRWKRAVLRAAKANPRLAGALEALRRRLG